jgi:CBS domain-containing protein
MTSNVITVIPDDRAWTAAALVTRVGITGLPVVDAGGAVLGMGNATPAALGWAGHRAL